MSNDLTLFVIMRDDMNSLRSLDRAAEQACHAQRVADVEVSEQAVFGDEARKNYQAWAAQTDQSFGSVTVLCSNLQDLEEVISRMGEAGFPSGVITDPSYPLKDGAVTHLAPVKTCGWAFGDRDLLNELGLNRLPYFSF